MNKENISPDSIDIWTKNIIQRYEERPADLEYLYLADFAANYTQRRFSEKHADDCDDESKDSPKSKRRRMQRKLHDYDKTDGNTDDETNSDTDDEQTHQLTNLYRRRRKSKII